MTYKSVHEYLDIVFANVVDPSSADIVKAKADYWKWYRLEYQKQRRTKVKEFTLGFDAETMQDIHNKRNGLSVSEFLYQSVYGAIQSEQGVTDTTLLGVIQQQQLQIIMLLERFLERNDTPLTESVLERMELLESTLQNLGR